MVEIDKTICTRELDYDQFMRLALSDVPPVAALTQIDDSFEIKDHIEKALDALTLRERGVVAKVFGLGGDELTVRELADAQDVTPMRIRQIIEKAIRKLQHPKVSHKLRSFVKV